MEIFEARSNLRDNIRISSDLRRSECEKRKEYEDEKTGWIWSAFLLLTMLMITACGDSDGAGAGGGGGGDYVWVLVDTEDHELSEIKSTEPGFEFTYTFDYSRGSYGVKEVFNGETKQVFEVKYVNGEAYGALCEFSEPPQIIGVNETVTLNVSMAETENSLSGWSGLVHGYARFSSAEAKLNESSPEDVYFKDSVGNQKQTLDTEKGIATLQTSVSAAPPVGEPGSRIALRTLLNIGALTTGTCYIYELQKQ